MKLEIFCRVIDNYGDVGFCWRLARALVAEQNVNVRLWVDDWKALVRLCPRALWDGVRVDGVQLRRWTEPFPVEEPADVVIEAFACELPKAHVQAMSVRAPVWINLEYLSAEDWVAGCHGLPSSPTKYFFFPGFTEGTGGLIRERNLIERRGKVLEKQSRADWLQKNGIAESGDSLLISLFSYEQPGLADLLSVWQASPTLLLVPKGRALARVEAELGVKLTVGTQVRRGSLCVAALPFLSQEDYDELLWRCDVNFVRGEDSFVRAQWAARPFIWQIYPQEDNAHQGKLEAFLTRYCVGFRETSELVAFWQAWNGRGDPAATWPAFVRILPELNAHAVRWCDRLCERPSLVTELWKFCRHRLEETR